MVFATSLRAILLGFLGGSVYSMLLFALLLAALVIGRDAWRRTGSPVLERTWLAAAAVLGCLLVWWLFSGLARLSGIQARLWLAPFDRLIAVCILVALGWTLIAPGRPRLWRVGLALGMAAALVAYAGWAPSWARELVSQANPTPAHIAFARSWDFLDLLLAMMVAAPLWRESSGSGRALKAALAALAGGALLQWGLPALDAHLPVWFRLGLLAASACLFASALAPGIHIYRNRLPAPVDGLLDRLGFTTPRPAAHAIEHGRNLPPAGTGPMPPIADAPHTDFRAPVHGPLRTEMDRAARTVRDGTTGAEVHRPPYGATPADATAAISAPLPVPELDLGVIPELVIAETLRAVAGELNAVPVVMALPEEPGELVAYSLTAPNGPLQCLGRLALGAHPTLARALVEGRLTLESVHLAADIQGLYTRLGLPARGPVLLQSISGGQPARRGVLLAGRARGRMHEADRSALERLARQATHRLAALDADAEARGNLRRVLAALETQAEAMTQLERSVGLLAGRIEHLEAAKAAPPVDTAAIATGAAAEAEARALSKTHAAQAALAERILRYEQTLDRLPWGVMVADAGGRVAFANGAAAQLLHTAAIQTGGQFADRFPEPDRMNYALHRVQTAAEQGAAAGDGAEAPRVETAFDSPALRVELEPLFAPALGYLGAVAVLHPATVEAAGVYRALVPPLADALRAPMTSILGYSDLIAHGSGLNEDLVGRYVHRIDANLSRMQIMLGNLLMVLHIDNERTPLPAEPVDVERAVHDALDQAQPQFEEKAISVNLAIDGPLPNASANPLALAQIIDNLLVNAAHRSPQGGDVMVSASFQEAGGQRAVLISVYDRGTQPSGSTLGVVAIDETADPPPVGLTMVRLLAEQQGGKAWAESDPSGARFHVRLPVRRAA